MPLISIKLLSKTAWVGQRVSLYVELRTPGSFSGATSFSLPEVASTQIIKVGNAVVSSEQIGDTTFFTQTHEFAIFSQQTGMVEIPEFKVRYGTRDGFTGPVTSQQGSVPASRVELKRPDASARDSYLVTTVSLEVSQLWSNELLTYEVGDVLERTVTQVASDVLGMALSPAPEAASESVKVYRSEPSVQDNNDRGRFVGKRVESLQYLFREPGRARIPAFQYESWNPKTQSLQVETLPGRMIEVIPSARTVAEKTSPPKNSSTLFAILATVVIGFGIAYWQRERLQIRYQAWHARRTAPLRIAMQEVRAGCKSNDSEATNAAWQKYRSLLPHDFQVSETLEGEVRVLQQQVYGRTPANPTSTWNGSKFLAAFEHSKQLSHARSPANSSPQNLPPLNPNP